MLCTAQRTCRPSVAVTAIIARTRQRRKSTFLRSAAVNYLLRPDYSSSFTISSRCPFSSSTLSTENTSTSTTSASTDSITTTSTTATSTILTNDPVEAVTQLCNCGKPFTLETWIQAEELFLVWNRRKQTPIVVHQLWKLWQRLVQEVAQEGGPPETCAGWCSLVATERWVDRWRLVLWDLRKTTTTTRPQRHTTPHDEQEQVLKHDEIPTPQQVYQALRQQNVVPVNAIILEQIVRASSGSNAIFAQTLLDHAIETTTARASNNNNDDDDDDDGDNTTLFLPPAVTFFNEVIRAWKFSNHPQALSRVRDVLNQMSTLHCSPNTVTYNLLIQSTVMHHDDDDDDDVARQAHEVLEQMMRDYYNGKQVPPDGVSFSTVFEALTAQARRRRHRQGRYDNIYNVGESLRDRCNRLVGQLVDFEIHFSIHESHYYTHAFNAAMKCCYAIDSTYQGAVWAQEIFDNHLRPQQRFDRISFRTLSYIWSQVGGFSQVSGLFDDMQAAYRGGRSDLLPESQVMNLCLAALAKSKLPDRVSRGAEILRHMNGESNPALRPTTFTYNSFLKVLSGSKDNFPMSTAEKILMEMKYRAANGNLSVKPNIATYSIVLDGWAKRGHADRVQQLLLLWFREVEEGTMTVKPDLRTFNIVLNGLSKAPRTKIEEVESLFKQLEDSSELQPDQYSYGAVLAAYGNQKHNREKNAAAAEAILTTMKERKDPLPNSVHYNSVINTWARARDPERAANVLETMFDDNKAGNSAAQPQLSSFNTVIKAWAYSNREDSGDQAKALIDSMIQMADNGSLSIRPNVISYTTWMLCYGLNKTPQGPEMGDKIMEEMFQLHEQGRLPPPTPTTWKTLERLWRQSTHPNRDARVREIRQQTTPRGERHVLPK